MNLRTVDKFLKKLLLELHYIYGEHLGRAAVFPTRTASHCIYSFWFRHSESPRRGVGVTPARSTTWGT